MKLIDNELIGTTPMDVIIRFNDQENEVDEEYDDLLGGETESAESDWFTTENKQD